MTRDAPLSSAHGQSSPGPGRPRGFALEAALDAGVELFRQRGFEATSLEALTEAMGISRSSFYAAFGSKHGVLIAALERYSAERLAALAEIAARPDPAPELLRALAGVAEDGNGCLLVNCMTELAPRDPEVAALGARHLRAIEAILARALGGRGALGGGGALARSTEAAPDARTGEGAEDRARTLLALALGAQTLRKAGSPAAEIEALLARAGPLLAPG